MDIHQTTQRQLTLGALYVAAAALMFALVGVFVKLSTAGLANETVLFWRNVISLDIMLPWALWKFPTNLRTPNLKFHFFRSIASTGSMFCFYYGVSVLSVSEGILLNFTAPLFVPLIGLALFRFPVNPRVIVAVIVGFVGIAMVLKPGAALFQPVAFIGLTGGFLGGLATALIWRMSGTETALRMIFYLALFGMIATAGPAFNSGGLPQDGHWPLLLGVGICSTLAQYLFAHGCSIAPSDRVSTLTYSSVVFAGVFGWLIWGHRPDAIAVGGAILVVSAGVIATRVRRRAIPAQPVHSDNE